MNKLTKKELLRLDELESKARGKFIENSDYVVEEWLDDEEEIKEYNLIMEKLLTQF